MPNDFETGAAQNSGTWKDAKGYGNEVWGSGKRSGKELVGSFTDPIGTIGMRGPQDIATPEGVKYDWTAADAAAGQSNALGGMLMQQAQGKGPSVAAGMLSTANQQNAANQAAQAKNASGGAMNRMLAQQNAANQGAQAAQQTAGQMTTMRNQEMINARQQAQQLYANQQQMAQQRQLGLGQQGIEQRGQNIGVSTTNLNNQRQNQKGVLGGIGGLVGGIASAFSDKRVKEDVRDAPREEMSALLEHLTPKFFRYKGREPMSIGVIAQEVRKGGPMGEAIVHEGDDGMLRIGGSESPALGVVLAELGALHDRVRELEGRKR